MGGSQCCSLLYLAPRVRHLLEWGEGRFAFLLPDVRASAFCFAIVLEQWWGKTGKRVLFLFLEGLAMRLLHLLAGKVSSVVIYLSHLHLKRRNLKACRGEKVCNFLYRNILQALERDGCFSQVLPACACPIWVWCATAFLLWLSGKQVLSPGCGEVGMGKSIEMLLGRTCFAEQVGYNHVVYAKLL